MSAFTQLHIIREQNSYGPYTLDQLVELVQQGQLLASDAISDGHNHWPDFNSFYAACQAAGSTTPNTQPSVALQPRKPAAPKFSQADFSKAHAKVRSSYMLILFIIAIPALLWASANDKQRGVGVNPNGRRAGTKQVLQENSGLFAPSCVVAGIALIPAIMLSMKRRKALQHIKQNIG